VSGVTISTILVFLAAAGLIASYVAGAIFSARAGAGALTVVWPLAVGRIRRAGGEPASQVNKALVAFIACLLVGAAAFSASANLHRFAK
jgi:hypothetical protein